MGTAAPAMMPTEDLETAIAMLPTKKDALREAFDNLAACSPYPLPFTWEDLDAHVSSVHSSISRRFRQLRVLEAAHPAQTSKNKDGANEVKEEEKVDVEEEEEVEVEEGEEVEVEMEEEEEVVEEEEGEEEDEEEEEVVVEEEEEEEEEEEQEEEEEVEEEEEEADDNMGNQAKDDKESGKDDKRDADEDVVTTKVSALQGKEADGEELDGYAQGNQEELDGYAQGNQEELDGHAQEDGDQEELDGYPAGRKKELVAACKRMDAGTLAKFVICVNFTLNRKLLSALCHASDPAALVLQAVKLFLSSKKFKCPMVWRKCVRLMRWLSMASAELSADTIEQAKLVAKDWKKIMGRPECCGDLDSLAAWALLHFLILYNIVSEFNIHEIICIFAMVPRKCQKNDTMKLCDGLGLADRATDLIDYMIGNGQHLEVFHLAQIFNLEDKYPLFSLLKGFIEKAKQTSMEIFRKNKTCKSLNLDTPKELWIAHHLAEQKLVDSVQRSGIMAEIKYLISGYAKKRRSANPSMASTSNSQHQPTKRKQRNKKRKKVEQEHHEGQDNRQQHEQNENKLIQGKQHQLHQQENKAQETEQQQHMQHPRPATLKLPPPAIPLVLNAAQIQNFWHPSYAAMPGVHNYPAQPSWRGAQGSQNFGHPSYAAMPGVHNYPAQPSWRGAQGSPPQLISAQYIGPPLNPFALHPTFCHR